MKLLSMLQRNQNSFIKTLASNQHSAISRNPENKVGHFVERDPFAYDPRHKRDAGNGRSDHDVKRGVLRDTKFDWLRKTNEPIKLRV